MTHAPLCTARVTVETEAGIHVGHSADLLAPKWFEKDPGKTIEEDWRGLLASAQSAAAVLAGKRGTVFDLWWELYRERVDAVPVDAPDRLVRGFGVALCERALMDAACRAGGMSFFTALQSDLFGFRPDKVLPELDGWDLAAGLAEPAESVQVRHTIGLVDPLRSEDVGADERLDDGLPQSLEENIRHYGLKVFKIKLQGNRELDLARLRTLATIFDETVEGTPTFTVDGNEQFDDIGQVADLFEELGRMPEGARFLEGLLYVEQPLSRTVTFDEARNADVGRLGAFAALIIDEADSGIDSFRRATDLGYRGISVKNCKGVFRALLNRGLCEVSEDGLFQSAEDLTNLPLLALQQDLTTVAALGFEHVERNGHHYFHGLDHLPRAEVELALERHPGLYDRSAKGAFLAIRGGALDLRSLACIGYGHDVPADMDARTPAPEWLEALS
ncbi:MAG: mandelate racemase [bacterium]|nr:mandelate racemase [bacterium]